MAARRRGTAAVLGAVAVTTVALVAGPGGARPAGAATGLKGFAGCAELRRWAAAAALDRVGPYGLDDGWRVAELDAGAPVAVAAAGAARTVDALLGVRL